MVIIPHVIVDVDSNPEELQEKYPDPDIIHTTRLIIREANYSRSPIIRTRRGRKKKFELWKVRNMGVHLVEVL